MNGITIPHSLGLQPGTWKGTKAADGHQTALLCCPCGHIASLSSHTIRSNGNVFPSVVCPEPGCGFHEAVYLDGWERLHGDPFEPGGDLAKKEKKVSP